MNQAGKLVWARVPALDASQIFYHGEYTLGLMVIVSDSSLGCILSYPGSLMGKSCSQVRRVKPKRSCLALYTHTKKGR